MREKSRKNILIVTTAVASIAAIALWQFFVFATFKNAAGVIDIQGGAIHLWLPMGFTLAAFIGAFLVASFFLRDDRNEELHITSPPQSRAAVR
jgi:hypothetical protein